MASLASSMHGAATLRVSQWSASTSAATSAGRLVVRCGSKMSKDTFSSLLSSKGEAKETPKPAPALAKTSATAEDKPKVGEKPAIQAQAKTEAATAAPKPAAAASAAVSGAAVPTKSAAAADPATTKKTESKLSEEILAVAAAALQDVKHTADERILALEDEKKYLLARIQHLEAELAEYKSGAASAGAATEKVPAKAQAVAAPAAPAPATVPAEVEVVPVEEASPKQDLQWPEVGEKPPFWTRLPRGGPVGAALTTGTGGAVTAGGQQDGEKIHVVHITAEMAPLAKVGGLGDVVTGLGRACLSRGHKVDVMLPFYECLDKEQIQDLAQVRSFGSYFKGDWIGVQVHSGLIAGVPVLLLKPENHFFLGGRIYGGSYNELEAYLFFSRACLEYLQTSGTQPDILHVHEWHTAGVSLLYWDMYHSMGLTKPRLILTIHNLEHHGECRYEQLDMIGLDGQSYLTVEKAMDDRTIGHNPERLSLLKGGIVYCNTVTTVSPTYARETLCGGWLSNTLLKYREKYHGVLNGIDTDLWDPQVDGLLPAPYSASDLEGKRVCKHYLQRGLGLDLELEEGDLRTGANPKRRALVICVTRLVAQKGIHLIKHAIFRTRELGGQFVLLGSSPDGRIQGDFAKLAEEMDKTSDTRLILAYSESLAHLLFAAADVILVPSMFEPCGLTQMIGMRYGTVPVVRRTGGLADTVFDVDDPNHKDTGNGFVFDGIDEGSLNGSLDRAIQFYRERPEWWEELVARVMRIDNSWDKAAGEYMNLYNSIRVR